MNEAIADARQRFYEARRFGRVLEGSAQASDGVVEAVIEVEINGRWPNSLPQLRPRDHLSGVFDEKLENAKRLNLQRDPPAVAAQLASSTVHLEGVEP